jgi:hypothetical protein
MRPGKGCPGDDVLAETTDILTHRRQGFTHHQRHPGTNRGTLDRLGDNLGQYVPKHPFDRAWDVRSRTADRASGDTVFPSVIDRLVVGLAGLDLLGIDGCQILGQRGDTHPQSRPSQGTDPGSDNRHG